MNVMLFDLIAWVCAIVAAVHLVARAGLMGRDRRMIAA
jgi:hypothetical protein